MQIITHPLNTLAEFITREVDRVVALAEEDHAEWVKTQGSKKRDSEVGMKSGSTPDARGSTITSDAHTHEKSGPATRTS